MGLVNPKNSILKSSEISKKLKKVRLSLEFNVCEQDSQNISLSSNDHQEARDHTVCNIVQCAVF